MSKEVLVGIDIGGTKIAVAVADLQGRIMAKGRFPTQVEAEPRAIIEKIVRQTEDMVAQCGGRPVAAVGVGCGGPLDPASGVILSPPNLPGWDRIPLGDMLAAAFKAPVSVDNDANAAALGEYRFGAGMGCRVFVYVTVSTGIGGGVVIDGKLLHGVGAGAGEIGHQTILPDGPLCNCGNRGCLEALASGTAIARRMRERLREKGRRTLMGADVDAITSEGVARAAIAKDPLAAEVWRETVEFLGIGLANAITMLAPEVVVIGGGVAKTGDALFGPVREEVKRRVFLVPMSGVSIVPSKLGDDVGVIGAVTLAMAREYSVLRK